jgi:hypothetical protein
MNDLNQFKEAAERISTYRKEAKKEMDNLANNVYSTINQMNFSIKLIVDTNNFITKYINSETSILQKLTMALTQEMSEDNEINVRLSDNVAFNTLFLSSVLFFENYAKMLMESVSHYLVHNNGTSNRSLREVYDDYCKYVFIKNDWELFKKSFNSLYKNYRDVFTITPADNLTSRQISLLEEYNEYVLVFNNLVTIFDIGDVTQLTLSEMHDDIIPAIQGIINFRSMSNIYDRHLEKLGSLLDETSELFKRIFHYATTLINHNTEMQPYFKDDNLYISTIVDVCSISNDLISALKIKYPNKDLRQGLIMDGDFNKVLTTINNLFRKEINNFSKLIDIASKDYKLIRSLESFITTDRSINNSILFDIMNNFDEELLEVYISDDVRLGSVIRLYFDKTDNSSEAFGKNSFTKVLSESMVMTEPMYDILNYYRLFLYPFTNDTSLIFDFLETLHIFNLSLTSSEFSNSMDKLFEIKIDNIDYINVNGSKINESLTARYNELNKLNYFDIVPYINKIKETDLSTILTKENLKDMFKDLDGYNLIMFSLIENILYNGLDLNLLFRTLSTRTNIRSSLFKLLFIVATNKLKLTIEEYYDNSVPNNVTIYRDLVNNDIDFIDDLDFLKTLSLANDYYNGKGDIFNINRITNFDSPTYDYIWDKDKINHIIKLFSLYKEV